MSLETTDILQATDPRSDNVLANPNVSSKAPTASLRPGGGRYDFSQRSVSPNDGSLAPSSLKSGFTQGNAGPASLNVIAVPPDSSTPVYSTLLAQRVALNHPDWKAEDVEGLTEKITERMALMGQTPHHHYQHEAHSTQQQTPSVESTFNGKPKKTPQISAFEPPDDGNDTGGDGKSPGSSHHQIRHKHRGLHA